jgi:hypothetical protein
MDQEKNFNWGPKKAGVMITVILVGVLIVWMVQSPQVIKEKIQEIPRSEAAVVNTTTDSMKSSTPFPHVVKDRRAETARGSEVNENFKVPLSSISVWFKQFVKENPHLYPSFARTFYPSMNSTFNTTIEKSTLKTTSSTNRPSSEDVQDEAGLEATNVVSMLKTTLEATNVVAMLKTTSSITPPSSEDVQDEAGLEATNVVSNEDLLKSS